MDKLSVVKARAILGCAMIFCAAIFSWRVGARAHALEHAREFAGFAAEFAPETAHLGFPATDNFGKPLSAVALKEVTVTHQAAYSARQTRPRLEPLSAEYIAQLKDFDYLTRSIFLADPRTRLLPSDIDVEAFLAKDLTIDTTVSGPQVLIFHAHSMEMFIDSDPYDKMTGVFGVGQYLAEILSTRYGIEVMHHMERFDMVDGMPMRPGSYERLEPVITQILAENPSIQMVIDLHRDGVGPHVRPMVTYIDGKRTAQIMFVNGLSRRYRNGIVSTVYHLPNPYQAENLAFSLNLQLAANQLYPGITRRIYLLEFRYSLHMTPLSILLEVGAQNNTFQEALNAMHPTANIIASVVLRD